MSQYVVSSEGNLELEYVKIIQPFWQDKVQLGRFSGKDNVEIAYAYVIHPHAVGSIVISTGRIECFLKYKEVVYDVYQNGYSVFIHDHRGQGLSARMTDNLHMGYVASFTDYVTDFKEFIDLVVTPNSQSKPYMLCHSMGGAIGAQMILAYPQVFEKVAFSAPMFGIRPVLPNWLSKLLFKLHGAISTPSAYFFGQKDYDNQPFAGNDLTHSEVRYDIFRQEYQQSPNVQLGGVTGQWLIAAALSMDEIEQNAQKFPIPALVVQAGADQIVDNKRQRRVATKMANTKLMVINDAKHELLAEKDLYRKPSLFAVLDFFAVSSDRYTHVI